VQFPQIVGGGGEEPFAVARVQATAGHGQLLDTHLRGMIVYKVSSDPPPAPVPEPEPQPQPVPNVVHSYKAE
jgi:hypothetical protein